VSAADVWLNKRSYTEAEHLNVHRLSGLLYTIKCLGRVTDNVAVQLNAIAGDCQSHVLCKVYSYFIAHVSVSDFMLRNSAIILFMIHRKLLHLASFHETLLLCIFMHLPVSSHWRHAVFSLSIRVSVIIY